MDYKKVAETLLHKRTHGDELLDAAIDLCERMARGELVERTELQPHEKAMAAELSNLTAKNERLRDQFEAHYREREEFHTENDRLRLELSAYRRETNDYGKDVAILKARVAELESGIAAWCAAPAGEDQDELDALIALLPEGLVER